MKRLFGLVVFLAVFAVGCAHNPESVLSDGPSTFSVQSPRIAEISADMNFPLKYRLVSTESKNDTSMGAMEDAQADETDLYEYYGGGEEEEITTIADPLEPFNRAMYHFNDKLYFWILKPVAQGYGKVVPETGRAGIKRFFANLGFPKRFVSCLLQADFGGAVTEVGRFTINTLWGVGGFLDPAASEQLKLRQQNADLGQTLGIYGIGQGFYIVWPGLGPSSLRDSIDIPGEYFLYPVSYLDLWYEGLSVRGVREVNNVSLRIGDYEALKKAAIDPYVSIRNAYIQYRRHQVKEREKKSALIQPGGTRLGVAH